MTDKEFGDIIKRKLAEFQPEYDPDSWDMLEQKLNASENALSDDAFDASMRAALGAFSVEDAPAGWDALAQKLDADESALMDDSFDATVRSAFTAFSVEDAPSGWDAMREKLDHIENQAFDSGIRESIDGYEEPYDSTSWPMLDEKIDADERLRRRLLIAKVMEVAAVLLIIFTAYNLLPDIKQAILESKVSDDRITDPVRDGYELSVAKTSSLFEEVMGTSPEGQDHGLSGHGQEVVLATTVLRGGEYEISSISTSTGTESVYKQPGLLAPSNSQILFDVVNLEDDACAVDPDLAKRNMIEALPQIAEVSMVDAFSNEIDYGSPEVKRARSRKNLRMSISASADINALYMPAEQFYTGGEKIRFNDRTLVAMGYSAGAGLIFDHGKWSFETGIYYSSKVYEPNRVLQIGKAFDARTLDFEEISLHVVNIPMHVFWNFDRKGKTRFYAVAGAGINIIASANYDLLTRSNFRSAPPGGGSSTDLELRQVKEHILDGAEFSSKSFVTVVGGFGVEHYLGERLSVFTQPTYNYQVPFFHFSDQNGKHLQSLSVQFGTRVRLK